MFSKFFSSGNPDRCITRHASRPPLYYLRVNPSLFSDTVLSSRTLFYLCTESKQYNLLGLSCNLTSLSRRTILEKIVPPLSKTTRNFFIALDIERILAIPVGSY